MERKLAAILSADVRDPAETERVLAALRKAGLQ
jgi:hypothetical protein